MSRLRVAPIVEGHGEDNAVRILLQRIWMELLGGEYIDVLKPLRVSKLKLVQPRELSRTVELAVRNLRLKPLASRDPEMVLILLDADEDAPCLLGPRLLEIARAQRFDSNIACVVANVEYETWFVASAPSLTGYLNLSRDEALPDAPEVARLGKGWIQRRRIKYSETVDQPAMTRAMDLTLCRSKSPSFDKLCRDLDARLRQSAGASER